MSATLFFQLHSFAILSSFFRSCPHFLAGKADTSQTHFPKKNTLIVF